MKPAPAISSTSLPTFLIKSLNARKDEPVEAVIVRSGQEPIVVNFRYSKSGGRSRHSTADPFHSAPGKR